MSKDCNTLFIGNVNFLEMATHNSTKKSTLMNSNDSSLIHNKSYWNINTIPGKEKPIDSYNHLDNGTGGYLISLGK